MNEPTDKNNIPSDQASHETAALYVPTNRLAKVDGIEVFTPRANRVMSRDQAVAPTTQHERDDTVVMPPPSSSYRGHASTSGALATSVLNRLHGSNSDELFAAALRSKQESLINTATPRFTLVGKLGEGSQGIVYRINDRDCHREVACKVLSYATSDPEEISRFIHEAQVTAQLEHPGVVPIHDLGELRDGTVYYTMKRIDGVSLLDLLTAKGGKAEHRYDLLQVFLRMCETMAFAHSRGVIHRDLKPRNVMVGPFGEVLVLDWGLAKVVNCADVVRPMGTMRSFPEADAYRTLNGTAVGTPAYMSPEQAMGEVDSLDRRCDVYSLGVILYEMLAGASPYVRGEARKVMHQVSHGIWTRLDARRDCPLPRALVAIVHRAMSFDRSERYQTVEQLSADLRAFIAGGAVSVYRETAVEKLVRVVTHHQRQVRVGLAVALVAVLVGGVVWGSYWFEQERTITSLHAQLETLLAQRNFVEASTVADRIQTLHKDDRIALRKLPQIQEGLRRLGEARVMATKRSEADTLIQQANAIAAEENEASLSAARDLYMRALGLVGDDQIITAAYQGVSNRLALLEAKRRQSETEEKKRLGALSAIESAQRAMEWAKPKRVELALKNKERRTLEAANRVGDDPTLRTRLHALEEAIESQREELAKLEGRATNFFDQAVGLAPDDVGVRQAVADFYMVLMLDYEARGDLAGALMAENRCRMFDKGRYTEVLSGQARVRAAPEEVPITIQALSEGSDRTLDPVREVMPVPKDEDLKLLHGRYLVRNALGTVKALRLRRGDRLELSLPAPPASLPQNVVFIPAGAVIDSDGSIVEEVTTSFALAKYEVTCGEWLLFLNDPSTQAMIAANEAAGELLLIPREGKKPLWPRNDDGSFRLPVAADGLAVEASWPISLISGRDALIYAKWLSRRDQQEWRLPTHGEWMLAAQGGDGRPYPWGLRADLGFSASALGSTVGPWCASPVGSHTVDRSVQGVYDLGGSVAELVLHDGTVRVAAGGSHRDRQAEAFGVSSRRNVTDNQSEPGIGLRLALTISPTAR